MPDPISWSFAWPYLLAALIAGYLLGSIPFGLVLTRLAGKGDIRQVGSGNIGATNVLRTGSKGLPRYFGFGGIDGDGKICFTANVFNGRDHTLKLF